MTAMIAAVQYLRTGFFGTIAVVGCEVGSVFGLLDKDDPRFSKQDAVNACMIGMLYCGCRFSLSDDAE